MELSSLHLRRSGYGIDKGELTGSLVVTTMSGEVNLKLSGKNAEKILAVVADQLVEQAQEVAHNITRDILEHNPNKALEHQS